MPGLVGICGEHITTAPTSVLRAANDTVYTPKVLTKDLHADHHLVMAKSYFRFIETEHHHFANSDVQVWIDGEIYRYPTSQQSFSEELVHHYQHASLKEWLHKVDGIFVAVIYDLRKKQLQLITDRYGLKIFYVSAKQQCFMFAPELKCFTAFQEFKMQIRADMIGCFVQLEHFMGNHTWFEGVEVATPATIYTYRWTTNTLSKEHYWTWSDIHRIDTTLDAGAETLGDRLQEAVKLRAQGNGSVGVGLSGGFDSRAILASVRERKPVTYTFGIENSADVRLAKKAADVAGVRNVYFDMKVENWLPKRFSGVWKTDGMINMYHMHYTHLMQDIAGILDINLSGFLGDAVMGTYLSKRGKSFVNQRINEDIAQHYYGKYWDLCDVRDPFFDIDKIDPYLVYNRGRRLIGLGMEEANKTIAQRAPFMDVKLMDFVYGLPDEFRRNSVIYHRALVTKFPEFFAVIPHATAGVPIQLEPSIMYRARKVYHHLMGMVKGKLDIATSFTDVSNWIRTPETANYLRTTLDPKTALYANFIDANFAETYLEPHLKRKANYRKQVMGALTLEIWLQQLINKKYRND